MQGLQGSMLCSFGSKQSKVGAILGSFGAQVEFFAYRCFFCDFGRPTMGKVRPTMGQTRKGTQGKLSATGAQHWPLGGLCGSEESPNGALLSDETAELVVPSGTGGQ